MIFVQQDFCGGVSVSKSDPVPLWRSGGDIQTFIPALINISDDKMEFNDDF